MSRVAFAQARGVSRYDHNRRRGRVAAVSHAFVPVVCVLVHLGAGELDNVLLYFRVQYDQIQNLYRTSHWTFAKKKNYIAPVADELFQQAAPVSSTTGADRPRGIDYDDVDWSAFSTFDLDSPPELRPCDLQACVPNLPGQAAPVATAVADSSQFQPASQNVDQAQL